MSNTNEPNVVLINESEAPLDGCDTQNDDICITEPFDTTKIRVDTKNAQMDALIKRIKHEEIDLSPSFQRQSGIWNDQVQSRLIESMLIRIPLPAFYMDATDDDKWIVVDGLQRLTTIRRFVVKEELALTGLEFLTEYEGKKFNELPRSFQRRIEETDIVLYLIQAGTPSKVKFNIFKRINTGGEPLSAQEIRHALYQGQITDFLKELASSEAFQNATANGISPKRMDDRECVLRFLAFYLNSPDEYSNDDFDGFLNASMVQINEMDHGEMENLKQKFLISMMTAKSIFGVDAFRKRYQRQNDRYPINKALFESWSVNLAKLNDTDRSLLIERKEELINKYILLLSNNKEFESSISQGTGSIKKVKIRFECIRAIIKEVLDD